jgi:hypothetical protein
MDSHRSQRNEPTIPHENHPFCCLRSNEKKSFHPNKKPSGQKLSAQTVGLLNLAVHVVDSTNPSVLHGIIDL